MNQAGSRAAGIEQYASVGRQSGVAGANPHRLIQMLMEGALEKIAIAKGHMERGETSKKGEFVSWAISIIDGLRMSLDKDYGGEIVNNLDALYEYMTSRLVEANLHSNVDMLDEVSGLLKTVKAGWDDIENAVLQDPHNQVSSGGGDYSNMMKATVR